MREYKLISADGHINEPPDLWSERLPKRYQDRWPRMERFDEGDAWIIEGWQGPINFGGNISGAIPLMERSPWKFWEDVPPGGYDPASRLKEQDIDGVDAEVVYPTPRPSMAILGNPDSVFQLECVRTYNDWLSEYAGHAPDRLIGAAMMPTTGLQPTLAELERTMKMPGLRTPLLSQWPSGGAAIAP
ncbi:amidohydrolase, partial [Dehalococcoidia bacterium]|nr:amidohydrolase [Dehalococcoidia bacterium]